MALDDVPQKMYLKEGAPRSETDHGPQQRDGGHRRWSNPSQRRFRKSARPRVRKRDEYQLQLLLSVEEAADVLRLGRTRTYELVMNRKIQSIKVGRRRLVVGSSLVDFVQALLLEQDSNRA